MLINVLVVLISLISGIGVYVSISNRIMGRLNIEWLKRILLVTLFLGIVGVFIIVGYWLTTRDVGWLMIVPLFFLIIGEVKSVILRRRLRADPPVIQESGSMSILKPVTTTDLQIFQYDVGFADAPFQRLRITMLSDLHFNKDIPEAYYRMVVDRINQTAADFIFVAGDYITERRHIPQIPAILKGLKAKHGTFGILGNHDYWVNAREVSAAVRSTGITLLDDGLQRLNIDKGACVTLVGCEQPWGGSSCCFDFNDNDFVLAISHSADQIYKLADQGVRAVFSGHYHSGQFQIPGLGPIFIPSDYGRRFSHGHYKVNGTHLFVSAGIGAGSPPLRIYCPPDFFVVDFVKTGGSSPSMD